MNALFAAAKEICDFMKARRCKFCVIGGLAVQRWREPRLTQIRREELKDCKYDSRIVDALLEIGAKSPQNLISP